MTEEEAQTTAGERHRHVVRLRPPRATRKDIRAGLRACECALPRDPPAAFPRSWERSGMSLEARTARLPLRGQRRPCPQGAPASRFIPWQRGFGTPERTQL